jgi:hypothetical protein
MALMLRRRTQGVEMKKIVMLAVVAAVAALPAAAMAKKAKAEKEKTFAELNDPGIRFVRDGLPLILPTVLMPVYFQMHQDEAKKAKKH